jgi:hypothetical protein
VGFAAALLVVASFIALAPVTNGDNYCGRVYFDTVRSNACRSTMSGRLVWVLVLAAGSIAIMAAVLIARHRPWLLLAGALGIIAIGSALLGGNRLLEPTPPTQFCGSVLNRHGPYEPAREAQCEELLAPYRRAAVLAFATAAVTGTAAIAVGIRTARVADG